jgi:hypothetical protein
MEKIRDELDEVLPNIDMVSLNGGLRRSNTMGEFAK